MNTVDRRTILASGALALAGAATQSVPAQAQAGGKAIFSLPAITIPIVGEEGVFPVRRIYCIGRNYAAHAIERGSDPTREPPFFFQKPTDAIQNVAIGTVADHPPIRR
jgi:fumarylpyruvate hydrolase